MGYIDIVWIAWRSTGIVLHVIAVGIYGYLIVRDSVICKPSMRRFPGSYKFLTHLNIWIQLITFSVCLICDILPYNFSINSSTLLLSTPSINNDNGNKNNKNSGNVESGLSISTNHVASTTTGGYINSIKLTIFNVRDNMTLAVAFPVGTFVTLMFWGLYFYDEKSVMEDPKSTPMYIQHLQHTLVAPIILAEVLLCHHRVISTKLALTTLFIFTVAYTGWLLFLGYYLHNWAYPLFTKMTWWQIMLFLAAVWLSIYVLFRLGLYLTRKFWPHQRLEKFYKCHKESYELGVR